jgi:hypothetical protein
MIPELDDDKAGDVGSVNQTKAKRVKSVNAMFEILAFVDEAAEASQPSTSGTYLGNDQHR